MINTSFFLLSKRDLCNFGFVATYGDDNLIALNDEGKKFMPAEALSAKLQEVGLKYTSADKTGAAVYTALASCDFLKRKFVLNSVYGVLCPLDKQVIYNMVSWRSKAKKEVFPDVLRTALMESAIIEDSLYYMLRTDIRNYFDSSGKQSYAYLSLNRDAVLNEIKCELYDADLIESAMYM